jgi:uroporphyrinogen-III synthase
MRVLVTRPQPAARRTAERLGALGHTPVILPLTQTVAVPVDPRLLDRDFDAVAVTSANALRHATRAVLAPLAGLPCQAVGKRTAAAAREAGFRLVISGSGVAEGLSARIAESGPRAVAYLCGRVRRPDFEAALAAAGIAATAVETYDTVAADLSPASLAAAFAKPVGAVLLYSQTAARAFAELVAAKAKVAEAVEDASMLCLSGRIASALDPSFREKVAVAREPEEEALLSLLAGRA